MLSDWVSPKEDSERREALYRLVILQMENLVALGVKDECLQGLRNQQGEIINHLLRVWEHYGFSPFQNLAKQGIIVGLPVVPRRIIGIYEQTLAIKFRGQQAFWSVGQDEIADMLATPALPYYLFDVHEPREINPAANPKRLPLTLPEVLSLGAQTNALERFSYLYALASRHAGDYEQCPGVACLPGPSIEVAWFDAPSCKKFPTCGSRSS